jgi:hypothetical protein
MSNMDRSQRKQSVKQLLWNQLSGSQMTVWAVQNTRLKTKAAYTPFRISTGNAKLKLFKI